MTVKKIIQRVQEGLARDESRQDLADLVMREGRVDASTAMQIVMATAGENVSDVVGSDSR